MVEAVGTAANTLSQPVVVGVLILGTIIGYVFGIFPGLGPTAAMAIVLPLLFGMDPGVAMYLLAGIMGSCACGGAITAILLNAPGTAVNAATTLDGYPMAQKGQAYDALSLAALSSLFGAIFGVVVLVALIPVVRLVILSFGPAEYFMMCCMAFAIISTVVKGNVVKGLVSICAGLLFSFVGFHHYTGAVRFDFGTNYLWEGIPIIPFFVGLFAIGEVFTMVSTGRRTISQAVTVERGGIKKGVPYALKTIWKYRGCFVRSSIVGTIVGIMPGVGGAVANFVSYLFARQFSKTPELFGTGHSEGVIASETANNAKDGGALLPTFAFGIPGSAEMAVLLGGFILLGLTPGPSLLLEHLDLLYSILFALIISGILATLWTVFFAGSLARIATVNLAFIIPVIVALSFLGSYAIRGSMFDILIAISFGVIGYGMRKTGFPIVPMIIGYVIGNLAENSLLQALGIGGFASLFTRPISLALFIFTIIIFVLPFAKRR